MKLKSRRGFSHRETQLMKTKLWCDACHEAVKAEVEEFGSLTPQAPSERGQTERVLDFWLFGLPMDSPLEESADSE